MYGVRLKQRECTDQVKVDSFLEQTETGFLGLTDGLMPYVVPLNYVWIKEKNAIYFHGAEEGRKMALIARNNEACLTVSVSNGTMPHPVPAKTDTAYLSVMVFGHLEAVRNLDEATEAMQAMLVKYAPGYYDAPLAKSHVERYVSSMGSHTAVFKLIIRERTAKENASN